MKTNRTRWLRLNVATDDKRTQMTSISDLNRRLRFTVRLQKRGGGNEKRDEEESHAHRFQNVQVRHCESENSPFRCSFAIIIARSSDRRGRIYLSVSFK